MSNKPAIPAVPHPGGDRSRFDSAVKETLETLTGRRRSPKITTLVSSESRWKDLLASITARTTGTGTPTYATFNGGPQRAYQFVVNDEVFVEVHVPHDWKRGTKIYFHVHWAGSSTNTSTVTWRISWQYSRGHGLGGFSTSADIDITQAHNGVAYGHNIAECSESQALLPPGCEPDGIFLLRVMLQAKSYTGDVYAFFVDCHYESDGQETTTKSPILGPDGNYGFVKNTNAVDDAVLAKVNELISLLQD